MGTYMVRVGYRHIGVKYSSITRGRESGPLEVLSNTDTPGTTVAVIQPCRMDYAILGWLSVLITSSKLSTSPSPSLLCVFFPVLSSTPVSLSLNISNHGCVGRSYR